MNIAIIINIILGIVLIGQSLKGLKQGGKKTSLNLALTVALAMPLYFLSPVIANGILSVEWVNTLISGVISTDIGSSIFYGGFIPFVYFTSFIGLKWLFGLIMSLDKSIKNKKRNKTKEKVLRNKKVRSGRNMAIPAEGYKQRMKRKEKEYNKKKNKVVGVFMGLLNGIIISIILSLSIVGIQKQAVEDNSFVELVEGYNNTLVSKVEGLFSINPFEEITEAINRQLIFEVE